MKEAALKLLSELMKNSHRSDRELAKATGLSQPTVSRIRARLEKERYISEYTVIPDFEKLGYEIAAMTFVKLKRTIVSPEQIEEARRSAREKLKNSHFAIIMLERGLGIEYDAVLIALYKNYTEYVEHMKELGSYEFLETFAIESFIINLKDPVHYRPLTFKKLAEHMLTIKKPVNEQAQSTPSMR
jgi:DNA-binding Lrp family transcriptional regulator